MSNSTESSDLPPPPYAESDPDPDTAPQLPDTPSPRREPAPKTAQPAVSVRIQEKPNFPPPAYSETPAIIIDDATESGEKSSQQETSVSPILWLFVILSILMFSPCGYLAFAFTCFAFWTETGGNVRAARYLSSVARICALAAFLMGLLVILSPHVVSEERESYCLFEKEYYQICI